MIRRLWGVEFTSGEDKLRLLYEAWHKPRAAAYEGEPTRPLLFRSRRYARAWCKAARARYQDRADDCKRWRFKAIPVTEILAPNGGSSAADYRDVRAEEALAELLVALDNARDKALAAAYATEIESDESACDLSVTVGLALVNFQARVEIAINRRASGANGKLCQPTGGEDVN